MTYENYASIELKKMRDKSPSSQDMRDLALLECWEMLKTMHDKTDSIVEKVNADELYKIDGESEFTELINSKTVCQVWSVLTDYFDTLKLIDPKTYNNIYSAIQNA